jgi:hypothetical protein
MEVQLHAFLISTLNTFLMKKDSPATTGYEAGSISGPECTLWKRKKTCSCRKSDLDSSVVQSVAMGHDVGSIPNSIMDFSHHNVQAATKPPTE